MDLARERQRLIAENRPRSYDLDDPEEVLRLYRECRGYLQTCHKKHGTDFEGRQFAMDALDALADKTKMLRAVGTASRRRDRTDPEGGIPGRSEATTR